MRLIRAPGVGCLRTESARDFVTAEPRSPPVSSDNPEPRGRDRTGEVGKRVAWEAELRDSREAQEGSIADDGDAASCRAVKHLWLFTMSALRLSSALLLLQSGSHLSSLPPMAVHLDGEALKPWEYLLQI
jgi:hypothetical protein